MIPLFLQTRLTHSTLLAGLIATLLSISSVSYAQTALEKERQAFPTVYEFLNLITPSVDTSLPPSAKSTALKVNQLLEQQKANEALQALDAFAAQYPDISRPFATENVQFLFLRARALEQLKQDDEAFTIYSRMTEQYPELPEPWNNLAALHYKQGQFDLAIEALNYALRINPDFVSARRNLAKVYVAKANQEIERLPTNSVSNP